MLLLIVNIHVGQSLKKMKQNDARFDREVYNFLAKYL